MTQSLAAMQTNIMATALPLFDRDVDRFAVYVLALRQSLRRGMGTPSLALANSLGIPPETTRRHVSALIAAGLCRRESSGIVATDAWRGEPILGLLTLSHDCFVRFVEGMRAVTALPPRGRSARSYDWLAGLQAVADLMLAVAATNRAVHRDWLDLVLFSTILYANYRSTDVIAGRRPVRMAQVARMLSLPTTTVQRHVAGMTGQSIEVAPEGLLVSESWLATPAARATSTETLGNVRRILASLEAKGFPFDAPASAYRNGRPVLIPIG